MSTPYLSPYGHPNDVPVGQKNSYTKKTRGQKCINSFLAHKLSHDCWLWFFWGGALTGPYQMVQFDGACGLGVGALLQETDYKGQEMDYPFRKSSILCCSVIKFLEPRVSQFWAMRPMLAAYQNFYHFFLLLLIIGQVSCFGNSRGFQPAKPNVFISCFIFYSY